jgi:hypothetical protein
MKPMPAKPRSSIIQVDGSGTPEIATLQFPAASSSLATMLMLPEVVYAPGTEKGFPFLYSHAGQNSPVGFAEIRHLRSHAPSPRQTSRAKGLFSITQTRTLKVSEDQQL